MEKESENIKNEDWRLQAITTIAKEFKGVNGIIHPVGTQVSLVSSIKFKDKNLSFRAPNVTALFLDFANTLSNEVKKDLEETNFNNSNSRLMPGTIHPKNEEEFFQTIEMIMGTIVFSYSALESFANEKIPKEYIYETKRSDNKCFEKYDKEQIERNVSLDLKLAEILPLITGVKSPKGGHLWNKYIKLKNLRDRIIHKKSYDKVSANADEESFWKSIITDQNSNFVSDVKDIISYYFKDKTQKPRWLRNIPFS